MDLFKVDDVICGMRIDPATAAGRSAFGRRLYYFCSEGCKAEFEAGPARYVSVITAPWSLTSDDPLRRANGATVRLRPALRYAHRGK